MKEAMTIICGCRPECRHLLLAEWLCQRNHIRKAMRRLAFIVADASREGNEPHRMGQGPVRRDQTDSYSRAAELVGSAWSGSAVSS